MGSRALSEIKTLLYMHSHIFGYYCSSLLATMATPMNRKTTPVGTPPTPMVTLSVEGHVHHFNGVIVVVLKYNFSNEEALVYMKELNIDANWNQKLYLQLQSGVISNFPVLQISQIMNVSIRITKAVDLLRCMHTKY